MKYKGGELDVKPIPLYKKTYIIAIFFHFRLKSRLNLLSEHTDFVLVRFPGHIPYALFLEGSNFLTETIKVSRPDGRVVTLEYNSGMLNRLDRLTAANYGMPINTNLCKNKFVKHVDKTIMLQAASIYTQGKGESWNVKDMFNLMLEIANTSLQVLWSDLFNQTK